MQRRGQYEKKKSNKKMWVKDYGRCVESSNQSGTFYSTKKNAFYKNGNAMKNV
jgi:hypothetical protein